MGGPRGGGVKFFLLCHNNLVQFSSLLCMVMIRSQAVGL